MNQYKIIEDNISFHQRNLPHLYLEGGTFFITYRLAGTLPSELVKQLREELELEKKKEEPQKSDFFLRYDSLLDKIDNNIRHLSDPRIATICKDQFHYYDGMEYDLIAYCIMSNHIHVVFTLKENSRGISKIMQSIKRYTARESNKVLGREGKFWQEESYDHLVRDSQELQSFVDYTLNNPVKAGLVNDWKDWRWSYLNENHT